MLKNGPNYYSEQNRGKRICLTVSNTWYQFEFSLMNDENYLGTWIFWPAAEDWTLS